MPDYYYASTSSTASSCNASFTSNSTAAYTSDWTAAYTSLRWEWTAVPQTERTAVPPDGTQEREALEAEKAARELAQLLMPPEVFHALAEGQEGLAIASHRVEGVVYQLPRNCRERVGVRQHGRTVGEVCFHPAEALPEWDQHLQRYMDLLLDEQEVWRKANLHLGTEQARRIRKLVLA